MCAGKQMGTRFALYIKIVGMTLFGTAMQQCETLRMEHIQTCSVSKI